VPLEVVIEDGLDDDDPFFLVKRLVVFFHMIAALSFACDLDKSCWKGIL
jgi:hypothetical protein